MSADLRDLFHAGAVQPHRPLDLVAIAAAVRHRRTRRHLAGSAALVAFAIAGSLVISGLGLRGPARPAITGREPQVPVAPPTEADDPATDDGAPAIVPDDRGPGQPADGASEPNGPNEPNDSSGSNGSVLGTADSAARPPAGEDPATQAPPHSAGSGTAFGPLAEWTFDQGFEGWQTSTGDDLGAFAGNKSASSDAVDPRQGWAPDSRGYNETAALRARRYAGPDEGGHAEVWSPRVILARDVALVRVSFRYRWETSAGDERDDAVSVSLNRWPSDKPWAGPSGDARMLVASLPRSDARTDGWVYVALELDASAWTRSEAPEVVLVLTSMFRRSDSTDDCGATGSADPVCDLGFTFDDVRLEVR